MTGAGVLRYRKQLKVKQADLAKQLGVHRITVSRWERDKVKIPEPTAKLIRLLSVQQRGRRRT